MCSSLFAFTRTCKHLKLGLNRKSLGKIENLFFDMLIIIFYFMELIPPAPPPPTPRPMPLPEPNLPSEPGQRFTPCFTFKEDQVCCKKIFLNQFTRD